MKETNQKTEKNGRLEKWSTSLDTYLDSQRDKPFEWGENDCVTFAAGAIKSVCGYDPLEILGKKWTNRKGALGVLRQLGGLEQATKDVATKHGWHQVPPSLAQRGDLMLMKGSNGPLLAICVGASVVAPSDKGWITLPTGEALFAWHVE